MICLSVIPIADAAAEPTEIHFYQRGYIEGGEGAATRLTDSAVAAFVRQHPVVNVKVVGLPWGKEGDLKLRAALLARGQIDLFRLAHDQLPGFIPSRGELLSPVEPLLTDADRTDFGSAALDAVTFKGHVMAWPLWSTALVLLANSDLLARAGIEPPAARPWTWDEFADALGRIKKATGADGQPADGLDAAARPPLFEWAPLLMAQCGPIVLDSAAAKPDSPVALAPGLADALGKVAAFRNEGLLAANFGADDDAQAQESFLRGRVAFLMSSPGFIAKLNAKQVPYRILPPPTGAWGRPITTGALGCFAVVASGDPAREAAAHQMARWLTSAEIAQAVPGWYLAPPARRSALDSYNQPGADRLRAILPTAQYLRTALSTGFMESVLIPKLQAAVMGELTPEAAVAEIEQSARRRQIAGP